MALATLKYGPKLEKTAANSLLRVLKKFREPAIVARDITSDYRDEAEQADLFLDRYEPSKSIIDRGPFGDRRGPYKGLYWKRVRGLPVSIPGSSKHNKGLAIDVRRGTALWTYLVKYGRNFGWIQTMPKDDPVHFEYFVARDQVRAKKIAAAKARAAAAAKAKAVAIAKVKKIQKILRVTRDGKPGSVTEREYGALTAAALRGFKTAIRRVKAIQKILGVKPDGRAKTITNKAWAALKSAATK